MNGKAKRDVYVDDDDDDDDDSEERDVAMTQLVPSDDDDAQFASDDDNEGDEPQKVEAMDGEKEDEEEEEEEEEDDDETQRVWVPEVRDCLRSVLLTAQMRKQMGGGRGWLKLLRLFCNNRRLDGVLRAVEYGQRELTALRGLLMPPPPSADAATMWYALPRHRATSLRCSVAGAGSAATAGPGPCALSGLQSQQRRVVVRFRLTVKKE